MVNYISRSLVSKCVEPTEVGKVFSMFGLFQVRFIFQIMISCLLHIYYIFALKSIYSYLPKANIHKQLFFIHR